MPLLEPLHETICVPHHGSDLQVIQLKAQLKRVKKSYQKILALQKKNNKNLKKTHTESLKPDKFKILYCEFKAQQKTRY